MLTLDKYFLVKLRHFIISIIVFFSLESNAELVTQPYLIKDDLLSSNTSLAEIYKNAFGNNQQLLPEKITLPLRINKNLIESINILSNKIEITYIEKQKILSILKSYLTTSVYQHIATDTTSENWLSVNTLKKINIEVTYNPLEVTIDINIKHKHLSRKLRSLLNNSTTNIIPENLLAPAKYSGYFNSRLYINHFNHKGTKENLFNLNIDSSINSNGYVFENEISYSPSNKAKNGNKLTRNSSRLVIDDLDNERRYKIGDISTDAYNLQASLKLGGLQVSHDTLWSSPDEYQPQGNYQFTLKNEADVEIYQDGNILPNKTEHLPAGTYQLSDLQIKTYNKIKLVIRDVFGKHEYKEFSRFHNGNLLSPDFSRYSFSIGVPANYTNQGLSYNSSKIIASSFYQRGLTETTTIGASLQTDGANHQLSLDSITSTPLANIAFTASTTQTTSHNIGKTAHIRISKPPSSTNNLFSRVNWNTSYEVTSSKYNPMNAHGENTYETVLNPNKSKLNLNANFSTYQSINIDLNYSRNIYWQKHQNSYSFGINAVKNINRTTDLSMSLLHQATNNRPENTIQIGLTKSLERSSQYNHKKIASIYNDRDKSIKTDYSFYKKNSDDVNFLYGNIQLDSSHTNKNLQGNLFYHDSTKEINASYQQSTVNNINHNNISLGLSTALVLADGNFALAHPVTDSFIIFDSIDNINQPIAINYGKTLFTHTLGKKHNLPDQFSALLKPNKKTTLSNLSSYKIQHLSIDSYSLPDDFNLNHTEIDLSPDYKSGYFFSTKQENFLSAIILFKNRRSQPFSLQGGELISKFNSNQKPIVFFTNQDGFSYLSGISPGEYLIKFHALPKSTILVNINKEDKQLNQQKPLTIVVNTND